MGKVAKGTQAKVARMPKCDFHPDCTGEYDFKTKSGPWANGCRKAYLANRYFDDLGLGKGQRLILVT